MSLKDCNVNSTVYNYKGRVYKYQHSILLYLYIYDSLREKQIVINNDKFSFVFIYYADYLRISY